jgi:AcrR family transcriptional regulator
MTELRERKKAKWADDREHPTKRALIDAVKLLLEQQPMSELTSEQVLEFSGKSKGSLYHHFEDFGDLVEHAQLERMSALLDKVFLRVKAHIVKDSDENLDLFEKILCLDVNVTNSFSIYLNNMTNDCVYIGKDSQRFCNKLAEPISSFKNSLSEFFKEILRSYPNSSAIGVHDLATVTMSFVLGKSLMFLCPYTDTYPLMDRKREAQIRAEEMVPQIKRSYRRSRSEGISLGVPICEP